MKGGNERMKKREINEKLKNVRMKNRRMKKIQDKNKKNIEKYRNIKIKKY